MTNRVIHFEIQADNVPRAKEFYENAFGWKIHQMMTEDSGGMNYWGVLTGSDDKPGINGGMYKRPDGESEKIQTYDCTILVDDIDKAVEAVRKNGGTIRREKSEIPGIGYFAGGVDTEGNIFGMMEPTEWSP